jgi:hypothetical protein
MNTNERLTDVCLFCNIVTQNVNHMTVSAKWVEVQKFVKLDGMSKLLPWQIHVVHDLQKLDIVTGIYCWELFQLLTWSNVHICTWQPFTSSMCVCVCMCACMHACCRWWQNTALQIAVQKDHGRLDMKDKLCCFLFYYTFVFSGTWSFIETQTFSCIYTCRFDKVT